MATRVRDDEDADAPGERDPDVAADRLLSEQVADRVDDGGHRLVLGEGAHRAGHGVGGHEGRADERQEDERVGERARAVHGLRGQARDDGEPGQRQGEQHQDAGDREPGQHAGPRAEAHERGRRSTTTTSEIRLATSEVSTCAHSTDERAIGMDWNRSKMPLFMSSEEPVRGVGDARRDRDQQDAGQQVVHVLVRPGVDRAAEHVDEQQHDGDRHDRGRDDGVQAAA